MAEPSGVERVLDVVDGVRGIGGTALLIGVGVAAILTGGIAGWAVGLVFIVGALALASAALRSAIFGRHRRA